MRMWKGFLQRMASAALAASPLFTLPACSPLIGSHGSIPAASVLASDESDGDIPALVIQKMARGPHDRRQSGEVRPGDDGYLNEIHSQPVVSVAEGALPLPDGAIQSDHVREPRPVMVAWRHFRHHRRMP